MSSSDNKRKRPHSANNDKYLTKTVEYLYSPYKKKNDYCKNYDQKCMAIQSSIDRIFSSLNKFLFFISPSKNTIYIIIK